MTMILRLTDGTTTVTLSGNGSTILGCTYAPRTPGVDVARLAQAARDGQPISRIVRGNVTEPAEIVLTGTTSQVEAVEQSIGQLFNQALERQRSGSGPKVYVEYAKTASSEVHRAELFHGRPLRDSDPARRRFQSGTNIVALGLSWERAFCWEGQEVQLTSGATVYNHDDGGQDNHWTVTAGNVVGDLPAPVIVQLTNTAGASRGYRRFHLAVARDGYDYVHMLEGENRVSGGSVITDSDASNGSHIQLTVNTTALIGWTLNTTLLGKTKGRWFRLLARVYPSSIALYVRPEIRDDAGLVTLWSGDEVRVPSSGGWQISDLGRVPLPPGGYTNAWSAALRLVLNCRSAGNTTFSCDFIQLTSTDSWIDLDQLGYLIVNNGTITIDCINEIYHAAGVPLYVPSGGPLMVWPNVNNRFYLLEYEALNCLIANSFNVSMWYRPRRVGL